MAQDAPTKAPEVVAAPQRFAVLSPALAVILRDLDMGRWMTARHGYDVWSPQSLPVVGDQAGVDYEALIEAKPTHVLMEWGNRPIPPRLESLAKEQGWTVENYNTLTLADLRETTRRLALLDKAQPAWDQHPLKREMDRAWSKRERDFAPAGRVLMLMSTEPTAAALGPGSAHAEILRLIGGVAAIEKGMPYIEMDAEDVLHLAPDVIVLIRPRVSDRAGKPEGANGMAKEGAGAQPVSARVLTREQIAAELGVLAKLEIPAVKNGRVGLIDHPLALLPSTSLIRFADDLAGLLDGWAKEAEKQPGR